MRSHTSVHLAHSVVTNPRLAAGSPPLLILHGLFGMARNWRSVAKSLARLHSPIVCADLRNHGDSPHHSDMSMSAMAADVRLLIETKLDGRPVHLMGHSMGGKVAMSTALEYSHLVHSLIVIDTSPQPSAAPPGWFRRTAELLHSLDLSRPPASSLSATKKAYSQLLTSVVSEKDIREFLLTNLIKEPDNLGKFRWRFNLPALRTHIEEIVNCELNNCSLVYNGPTIFIGGSKSAYINPQDPAIPRLFPGSRMTFIEGAGHAVHADRPTEFCAQVAKFLAELSYLNKDGC